MIRAGHLPISQARASCRRGKFFSAREKSHVSSESRKAWAREIMTTIKKSPGLSPGLFFPELAKQLERC